MEVKNIVILFALPSCLPCSILPFFPPCPPAVGFDLKIHLDSEFTLLQPLKRGRGEHIARPGINIMLLSPQT